MLLWGVVLVGHILVIAFWLSLFNILRGTNYGLAPFGTVIAIVSESFYLMIVGLSLAGEPFLANTFAAAPEAEKNIAVAAMTALGGVPLQLGSNSNNHLWGSGHTVRSCHGPWKRTQPLPRLGPGSARSIVYCQRNSSRRDHSSAHRIPRVLDLAYHCWDNSMETRTSNYYLA